MASKDLSYKINVDSSQAITGVKGFSRAVQDELRKVDSEFDETATSGQKVATVLSAMAKDLDSELGRAAVAAEALSTALGPELAGKADVGSIIGDLQRMGLTFEDIVTDADKLATSLKELDQVQVKGLDSGLGGVKTSMGELDDASRGAKSALANMIGNSVQDLGALGGVAGSAGVAIGQMAEYAAAARLAGQGFGSVVKSMAGVAGPIAGIALATQAIGAHLQELAETEAFNKERVDDFRGALEDTVLTASELVDVLSPDEEGVTDMFVRISDESVNVEKNVAAVFGTFQDFYKLVKAGRPALDAWVDSQIAAAEAQGLSAQELFALRKAMDDAKDGTLSEAGALQASISGHEDLVYAAVAAGSAVSGAGQASVDAAFDQQFYGDTVEDTGEKTKGTTVLTNLFGDAVRGVGGVLGEAAAAAFDTADAYVESVEALIEADEKSKAWKKTLEEIGVALEEALAPFKDGTAQADAFADAFAKIGRGAGLATLNRLGDTKEAFQDIFQAVRDNKDEIPNIFATGSERAREFNDLLQQAAQTVGQDLSRVLQDAGGEFQKVRDRAAELREQFRDQFAAQFGLDLNVDEQRAKVDALVNAVIPTDAEIEVGIKLAEHDLLKLKSDLALSELEKLLPATALQIRVDLAEGEITPQEAAQTAQVLLDQEELGIELTPHTAKADQDLIDFAAKERKAALTVHPTGLDDTNDAIQLGPGGQGWPGIRVPVVPVLPSGYTYPSGPGAGPFAAPTVGGLAAGTTAVTATSSGGVPGAFMVPVAAPRQQQPVVNLYTVINAGVVGDPFEVARAVEEGTRRNLRLMPVNP